MKAFIISLIVGVVIVGLGSYFVLHQSLINTATTISSHTQISEAVTSPNIPNSITFDGSTFSPAVLTVRTGTTVTIKNTSSADVQMDSNPHPIHTDDTDLNVGLVSPGQSQTFMVVKKGSFGYHDHLDPSIQGTITIE